MKRWSLKGMVRTDLFDRGVPWMRLLLETPRTNSLNIRPAERIRTAFVGLSCLMFGLALLLLEPWMAAAALLPLIGLVASNLPVYRWFARRRGVAFALAVVPFNILIYFVSGLSVVIATVAHMTNRPSHPTGPTSTFSGVAPERDSKHETLASSREIR